MGFYIQWSADFLTVQVVFYHLNPHYKILGLRHRQMDRKLWLAEAANETAAIYVFDMSSFHYVLYLLCSLPTIVSCIDTLLTSAFSTWVLSVHAVDSCSQWFCTVVVFSFVGHIWNRVLLPLQHLSQILECIVNKVLWCQRVNKRAGLLYKCKTKIEQLS